VLTLLLCCLPAGFTATVWPTAAAVGPTGQPYNSTITFYVVANMGVILFMFLLGCELDQTLLARQWRRSAPIALSAIMFPFGVGAAASVWLEVSSRRTLQLNVVQRQLLLLCTCSTSSCRAKQCCVSSRPCLLHHVHV
jgi:Kef-type K+ transport system membrane component KefB